MNVHKSVAAIAMLVAAISAAPFRLPANAAGAHAKPTLAAKAKAPHIIPETGVLDAADLTAIAKLASTAATDQFSDDPSLKYIGRTFSFMPESLLSTNYDKDTHVLTVETTTWMDVIVLGGDSTDSRYVGQNSFGASATITKQRGNGYGIEIPGSSYSRKPISFVATLEGAAARDLSKALRLRLYGTIKKASGVYATNNSAVSEHDLITQPTVSDPDDIWIKQYLIAVDFTKAEWIDTRTGAVIKTDDLGTTAAGVLSDEPHSIDSTHTQPPYPDISQRLGEQGTTVMQVAVDTSGNVTACTLSKSSGSARLDSAACDWVKTRWKWQPSSRGAIGIAATVAWNLKDVK
jgi:TonB family protein